MDLYEPTFTALKSIDRSIVKGGLIVFDEVTKKFGMVRKSYKDFLKINKNYKYFLISKKNRQPDVYLKNKLNLLIYFSINSMINHFSFFKKRLFIHKSYCRCRFHDSLNFF